MICPHCFEHLQMTRHTMKVMMQFHLNDKQCLDQISEKSIEEKFHAIEIKLRQAQSMMESLFPDFNSVPNAERFRTLRTVPNTNTVPSQLSAGPRCGSKTVRGMQYLLHPGRG